MRYEYAFDLQRIAEDISRRMFPHIRIDRIKCFRSYGSSSYRTIARCHALGKLMQLAMNVDAFYALEFLSEQFDNLNDVEKMKTIIHELMHIPETFGGGFKQHNIVTDTNVNRCYKSYIYLKEKEESLDWFKSQKKKR
jgi:predicted metallopeptidase